MWTLDSSLEYVVGNIGQRIKPDGGGWMEYNLFYVLLCCVNVLAGDLGECC